MAKRTYGMPFRTDHPLCAITSITSNNADRHICVRQVMLCGHSRSVPRAPRLDQSELLRSARPGAREWIGQKLISSLMLQRSPLPFARLGHIVRDNLPLSGKEGS